MKKTFCKYIVVILSFVLVLSGVVLTNKLMGSSIRDNTSQGIILQSTSRVKQIDCVSAPEFQLPTSNPAVLDEYGIGSVLEFTDATQDIALAEFRVPLGIDTSAQPMLQLEWSCPTADPTGDVVNVKWQIGYLWIAEDGTTDGAAETTTSAVYNVSSTAKGLVETDIQLASMASTDKRLHVQITRLGDATDDTANGVDANLFDMCLYYIINRLGEPI